MRTVGDEYAVQGSLSSHLSCWWRTECSLVQKPVCPPLWPGYRPWLTTNWRMTFNACLREFSDPFCSLSLKYALHAGCLLNTSLPCNWWSPCSSSGQRYWCAAGVPSHQLRPADQQGKLHPQVNITNPFSLNNVYFYMKVLQCGPSRPSNPERNGKYIVIATNSDVALVSWTWETFSSWMWPKGSLPFQITTLMEELFSVTCTG